MPWGDDIQDILKTALPLLASVYAGKKGHLGDFAVPYAQYMRQGEQDRFAREKEKNDLDYRTQQTADLKSYRDQSIAVDQDRIAQDQRETFERATVAAENDRLAKEAAFNRQLETALTPYENQDTLDMINEAGPENFKLKLPDGSSIDFNEANSKIGKFFRDPTGKYVSKQPAGLPSADALVPVPDPNNPDEAIYGTKVAGAPVYRTPQRPQRLPLERPGKPKVAVKLDSNSGEKVVTFTDAAGNSRELSESDVAAALDRLGKASDPATVQRVLSSPATMQDLLSR